MEDRQFLQNKKKAINFWLKSAKENFELANDMYKSKRWNFSMYMCQQTIEAFLKAIYIVKFAQRPPYIHKLPRLMELCQLKSPGDIDKKILRIDAHYIKARYKEDRFDPNVYNKRNAQILVKAMKEVLNWLSQEVNLKI